MFDIKLVIVLAVVVIAMGTVFGAFVIFNNGISGSIIIFQPLYDCSDTKVSRALSPDELYVAKSEVRDCGATTSFQSNVTLFNVSKEEISEEKGRSVLSIKRDHYFYLYWRDNKTLVILCKTCPEKPEEPFWQHEKVKRSVNSKSSNELVKYIYKLD